MSCRASAAPSTCLVILALAAGTARAAQDESYLPVPVDTAGLADGRFAAASMKLEKSIFKVDVVDVTLRLAPRAQQRLASLIGDVRDAADADSLEDRLVAAVVDSRGAWVRLRFLRDIGLDRFIREARSGLVKAADARFITRREARTLARQLPAWYAFLEGRGAERGDEMHYRIRGDTLRTVYLGEDGTRLLDQRDVGPERRRSVLGAYFAPGSDFRRPLLESLTAFPAEIHD